MSGSKAENDADTFWRKLGMAGFLFFLIKGLMWIAAAAVIHFAL